MPERPPTSEDHRQVAREAIEAGDTQMAIAWALLAIAEDLAELRRLERRRRP